MNEIISKLMMQMPDGVSTSTTEAECLAVQIAVLNGREGNLPDYDCPICRNKGTTYEVTTDGDWVARECKCMVKRRSLRRIRLSGLSELMKIYTFDNFKADTDSTRMLKAKAKAYVSNKEGWLYISGVPGSGKTHLCTAICSELLNSGKEVRYMLWRDDAPRLKAIVNDRDRYEETIDGYKTVPVLYIDDFLKGSITDADINLAFELLNARYNNPKLMTIISSERSIGDVLDLDEAVGSRIYERSRGFVMESPKVNRRTSGTETRIEAKK